MSMIEKIARAIYESRNGHGCKPWSRLIGDHQKHYLADARAALTALEEPTREMSFAGSDAMLEEDPESDLSSYDAEAIFVAMIRAAKETNNE